MKKFLLSLAAAAIATSAMAGTASITFSDNYSQNTVVDGTAIKLNSDVSVTFAKGTGGTAPQYYVTGTAVRMYAGNTMTVTASENITKIEITFGTSDGQNDITATPGTFESPVWTGEATSVVFTEAGSSGNRRIAAITVTYDGEGDDSGNTGGDNTPTEVTFDFSKDTYGAGPAYTDNNTKYVTTQNVATNEGVKVTFTPNGDTSNAWRFWSDGVRAYKGKDATFTVTAPEGKLLSNISWTVKSGATFAVAGTSDNVTGWSGSAEEVAFVYTNTSSNLALITLTVTLDDAGSSDKQPAGLAYSAGSANVDFGATSYTLPTLSNPNDLPVTYTSSVPSVATVSTTGEVEILNYGTTVITASSAATDAFYAGTASYTLTVTAVATSIAQIQEIAGSDKNLPVKVNFPLTVTFKNYSNVFVTDGTSAIQIYGTTPDYVVSDIIPAGWICTYTVYQDYTPELVPVTTPAAATEKNTSYKAPVVDGVDADMVNEVVVFENVMLSEATPATRDNFEVEYNGETITFRNNYTLESVPAGEYDILGLVSVYQGNVQVYVIEFAEAGTLGVADVEAADGEAVYYNLQGVRVLNPDRGLYFKVQNGKSTKILK